MSNFLGSVMCIVRRRYLSIIYWIVRALVIMMIPFGLGVSLAQAQNTQPPDQAPVTTDTNGVHQTDAGTTDTLGMFDPNLAIGVSSTTSNLPTEFALGLGGASTATLLALAGGTTSRGGQTTSPGPAPATNRGHNIQTTTAVREQANPPLVAQVNSVSSLEEAEEEGSWPNWARSIMGPVVGFVTTQSQSFWQTLVRTGRTISIPNLPGFKLVVENGKVFLKWVVGGVTIAKAAIATVLASGIVLLWTDPIVDEETEQAWLEEERRLREEEAQRERERQQQQIPQETPPTPAPQLPAEYSQWQQDAYQFVQNVINGAYSNSSEDYQAAVTYLQSLQTLNQELISAGLSPVTTQEFIDKVRARLDAGRYISQISHYIGQAEAGELVDLETFRQLTNDALYLSNQMEARWSVPGFYPENIRNLQLDWMRDLQQQRQYVSEINDYIARAEAGESIDYPAFEQLTNDALYLSNQMEARWSVPGFYSSQERDNHLALVQGFQIPDALPTEAPEPNIEPMPTNDPPEEEPPEEEPPDHPAPLPYMPDETEPPVPDIQAEQPSNSSPIHVPSPPIFPNEPGEDPIFIFTPIPGLEELLNGDNEPFIINPQPEEPIFVPNLIPDEPLPQLEPLPDTSQSETPPSPQASANNDQPRDEPSHQGQQAPDETNTTNRDDVEGLFSPNTDPGTQQAVRDFLDGRQIEGADGQTYRYGESVKDIDLQGKSAEEIDEELLARGFTKHEDVIRDPSTNEPIVVDGQTFRQVVYTHPDGGMVRVKPDGDPTNRYRPQPHSSKSVRNPPDASYRIFDYEAFKVDNAGNPVPKYPGHINNPHPSGSSEATTFADEVMNRAHTDLPVQPQTEEPESLNFGPNDLVYGPSAMGQLRDLANEAGGQLLTDLPKPPELGWVEFSLQTLDQAANRGTPVHFDLTHVQDLEGILAGTGPFADTVTAQELRHIAENWSRFRDIITFYIQGRKVNPPWED